MIPERLRGTTESVPAVCRTSVATTLRNVVVPAPLAPSSATHSPTRTSITKKDYAGAIGALDAFLTVNPTGEDADRARSLLAEARRQVGTVRR